MSVIAWPHQNESSTPPDSLLRDLSAKLRGRVERAFVFGSYGTSQFRAGSDVDLILVTDTTIPFIERPRLFDDLYDLHPNLDILVYTPEELASLLSETTGFWRSVKESLRELPDT